GRAPDPLEAESLEAQPSEERGRRREREHRGADVVTEAGKGQRRRATASADARLPLEHRDREPRPRQDDRGGESVGTGADDEGVGLRQVELLQRRRKNPAASLWRRGAVQSRPVKTRTRMIKTTSPRPPLGP